MPLDNELEAKIVREIEHSNDRAAAIVGAGVVEHSLGMAIMGRLRPMDEPNWRSLFENENSLLGSFHAKIQMGYALNLYSEPTLADLRALKRIRNAFAHRLEISTFDEAEIAKECEALICAKWLIWTERLAKDAGHRVRYESTVIHLASRFYFEASIDLGPLPGGHSASYDSWPLARPRS